jgi:hypothetical protein
MQIRHYISIKRSHIFSGVRVAQSTPNDVIVSQEIFEDTKAVIRSCKSKKDRQYNCQKKK